MKRITDFINKHKVVSIIIITFFSLVLIDALINNDFTDFKNLIESSIFLAIWIYIFFLLVSKKEYYCPKCNTKLKSKTSTCPNCGIESTDNEKTVKSKRVISKSKLFINIGTDMIFVPIAMGFLYLLLGSIFGAFSSSSFTLSNTILVFYTNESLLPIAIVFSLIGLVLVIIGCLYKKKENKNE